MARVAGYAIISCISTLLVQLNKIVRFIPQYASSSLVISLVLVVSGLFFQGLVRINASQAQNVFGGPVNQATALLDDTLLIADNFPADLSVSATDEDVAGFFFFDAASLQEPGSPLASDIPTREGLLIYTVKEGDTLSTIAAQYGISLNTVIWANSSVKASALSVGQKIMILPVSGVIHKVLSSDTLESVAALYGVSQEQIKKYNRTVTGVSLTQEQLIIPGAKPQQRIITGISNQLPRYSGYYAFPTTGWNWRRLHGNNGVDIANACGTQVYAAASGLVVDGTSLGYNGGYGNRVILEHANGTKTLYAHLSSSIMVEVGDYVSQGDLIALMGNTGNVKGPTGCHLHFEIWGAVNEFAL